MKRSWPAQGCAGILLCALIGTARADPQVASSPLEHQRAGWPQLISPLAVPSDTGHYVGNRVGGGSVFARKADPPFLDEGTWGWDYQGWLLPRRILLSWWHGRRYQGGTGAYKTDGPNVLHRLEERR